ncbi:hypothetical protein U1Q18_050142 [Sarracenia purpurea var. burkii]
MTRSELLTTLNDKIRQTFSEYEWMKNVEIDDISECSTVPELYNLIEGNLNEHELKYSILSFSIMLQQYFKKQVIILVDDYDYAFMNADSKHVIDFALLTGVGGKIFTENDPFNTLTIDLLRKYKCTKQEQSSISKYYKGYYTKKRHTIMYNPYSITRYLLSKKSGQPGVIKGYWVEQETPKFISLVLQVPEFRQQLNAILEEHDFIELSDNKPNKGAIFETFYNNILVWGVPVEKSDLEDLYRYFFDLGYFTYTAKDATLCIPNKEPAEPPPASSFIKSKISLKSTEFSGIASQTLVATREPDWEDNTYEDRIKTEYSLMVVVNIPGNNYRDGFDLWSYVPPGDPPVKKCKLTQLTPSK